MLPRATFSSQPASDSETHSEQSAPVKGMIMIIMPNPAAMPKATPLIEAVAHGIRQYCSANAPPRITVPMMK